MIILLGVNLSKQFVVSVYKQSYSSILTTLQCFQLGRHIKPEKSLGKIWTVLIQPKLACFKLMKQLLNYSIQLLQDTAKQSSNTDNYTMASPIVRLLSKFPLKTYPPEDITDIPLQAALAGRTFYYGCQDKVNVAPDFTLLVGSYQVDEKSNELFATDPDCLFIQCALARKHGLTLPRVQKSSVEKNDNNTKGNNKILSVDTKDVPMLLVSSSAEGNYMTRKELLQEIGEKYLSLKERQWAKLLASNVQRVWAQQLDCEQIISDHSYQESKCQDILQLFEHEYSKMPGNTYFHLKLDTLIFCIMQGPPTSIQAYIKNHCPTLATSCRPTVAC